MSHFFTHTTVAQRSAYGDYVRKHKAEHLAFTARGAGGKKATPVH